MASQTVRISASDYATLVALATASGKSMASTLSQAIRGLRRQRLLDATNKAYTKLRQNPKAWKDIKKERSLWDSTLSDGLV